MTGRRSVSITPSWTRHSPSRPWTRQPSRCRPPARKADLQVRQDRYGRLDAGSYPQSVATVPLPANEMRFSGYPFALELRLDAAEAGLPPSADGETD